MTRLVGVIGIGCLAISATLPWLSSQAADPVPASQSLFGGTVGRNMINTVDKNLPTTWNVDANKRKNIKWVVELGSQSYGGPVIHNGRVFVGTNNQKPRDPSVKGDKGILMCFRESDGQFLWQAVHEKLPNPQENDWPQCGVASTPAVEGDRVYYVSNRCELVCATVAGKDGKAEILWQLDMFKDLEVYPSYLANCSPLVAGDLVLVITGNGSDDGTHMVPAPKAPSFLAADKHTGKVIWKSDAPGTNILEGQWANPAYGVIGGVGQAIFPGGDGWIRSFEAKTGKPLWQFDANPKASVYKAGGRGDRNYFVSTPVVLDGKVFIGVGQNPDHGEGVGHFWCIDATKRGDLSPVKDNFDPAATENKNTGLVWHFGGKADPKVAAETNREIVFGRTISTAAIQDGILYIPEVAGFLHCLDSKTGKKLWDHDLKSSIWGSPYYVDGKVYLGNEDGDIYVFAHGREKKLLGTVEMKRAVKSTPVAANGVLYIMTDSHLFAIANQ